MASSWDEAITKRGAAKVAKAAARRKRQPYALYLNSGSDYSIEDDAGRTLTIAEARAKWESGSVTDYNQAFYRLATQFDFDVDRLRDHFRMLDADRRK